MSERVDEREKTTYSTKIFLSMVSPFIVSPAFGYARTLVGMMVVPIVS